MEVAGGGERKRFNVIMKTLSLLGTARVRCTAMDVACQNGN